jgi:hypothetical protein
MVVFSVTLPDEKLIQAAKGLKKIVILGCSVCANNSIAYEKGFPLSKMPEDNNARHLMPSPVAIVEEANRLKVLLADSVEDISVDISPGFCILGDSPGHGALGHVKTYDNVDAIVALCCVGGVAGLKMRFGDSMKIIPAMKTEGIIVAYTVSDKESGLAKIDRDKSQVIRNFKK